eukprot:371471_1
MSISFPDKLTELTLLTKGSNFLMGNLAAPIRSKLFNRYGNEHYQVCVCSMQGYRASMEDSHVVELSFKHHPEYSLFGIFDGHNGRKAAHHLSQNLIDKLDALPTLTDNKQIQSTILSMDEAFCCSSDGSNGCTIVFALVRPGGDDKYDIRVFWAGDSRAVLIGEDGFEQLTQDHRPDNPSEMARIEEAKGVIINNRVDSKLAVSRAFGDMNLKNNKSLEWEKQRVTALTEYRVARAASSDVLFLFCDGLVEYLDNAQLIGRFNSHLVEYEDPVYGLGYLFDEILDGGSRDNMSAIIIYFRAAKDYGLNGKHKTFLPGPLYLTRNDKKYVDAYLRNAKDFGHEDSPKLRRAAYREDLKLLKKYGTQGTGYSKSIMYQIEEVIREIDNTSSDNHNTTDHEMDGSTEVIERSPTPPLSDVDAEFLEHKEETQTMKRNHSMVVTPSPSPTNKETSNRKRTFANLNENNND